MLTASRTHTKVISARGYSLRSIVSHNHPMTHQTQTWPLAWQFNAMRDAYEESGGLIQAPELVSRWQAQGVSGTDLLTQWIQSRKVISFEWQSTVWLPVVQFSHNCMALVQGFEEIQSELVTVYNDCDLARWFSLPNNWLAARTPASALLSKASEVLIAARAERYVSARQALRGFVKDISNPNQRSSPQTMPKFWPIDTAMKRLQL